MVHAAILAGGKGTRMGGSVPKQFMEVSGVPIIVRTLKAFKNSGLVDDIVLCVPAECILGDMFLEYMQPMMMKYRTVFDGVKVIKGGSDRTGSLENACDYFMKNAGVTDGDIIITHDGVRPFITPEMIASGIDAARRYGGATAAVPCVDTICVSEDGATIDSVPDRSRLYSVQTPQTFMLREFSETLACLTEEEKSRVTDASAVFRLRGKTVALSQGSPDNIKITHPGDIPLAEKIAESFESGNG